jgi:hypothetical protein
MFFREEQRAPLHKTNVSMTVRKTNRDNNKERPTIIGPNPLRLRASLAALSDF